MGRAADRYLSAHPVDQDARLALWTADSLAVVTLALTRDPSIRVRREAMRLLSSVSVRVDTPAVRGGAGCGCCRNCSAAQTVGTKTLAPGHGGHHQDSSGACLGITHSVERQLLRYYCIAF